MEPLKPNNSTHGRSAFLGAALLVVPLISCTWTHGQDLSEKEYSRRAAAVEEAQELLSKGDEAYLAGRYADAVEAFAGARDLIPDAPVSTELRDAATDRYAQAAVEQARFLSRKGDVQAAKALLDQVLREGVAPNDPGASNFRAQLDDPIRTNPALTAEHAKDIDEVRRLLYTAEGAFNLGKFDESSEVYGKVLKIDPTNSAALRGMERVAAAKSGYQQAAYDHTRAEMINQVEAGWETAVPAPDLGTGPEDPGMVTPDFGSVTVAAKLDRIMIPKLALDQSTLEEALDLLRLRASENDTLESDPALRGVNFTVNLGPPDSEIAKTIRSQKFNLQISQVPLSQALKYITDITRTSYTTDDFAVIISPAGYSSDELIVRSYRVPPDFLTSISSGATAEGGAEDPFGEAPREGLLTVRLSAQEALSKQGISFPQGASANHNRATNTLRVVNTAANQDVISQLVEATARTEPVMVAVRVTMIKTQQTNLEELGFDWLLSPFALNSNDSVFGAGGTVGNSAGRAGGDFLSPVDGVPIAGVPADPTALVGSGVMTNGLRSGDSAISEASIDNLLSDQSRGTQQNFAAPGIMSVTGLFTDGQVQTVMRGMEQSKSVDIMARPSTVTRSGQASTVSITREFIYPSEYEPPELPNSVGVTGSSPVTPSTPTAFEKKDVGIILEVLPVADANKRYIDVTLNPSFTDFDGFVNYGSPINTSVNGLQGPQTTEVTPNTILMPIFSAQKANTQLTVADGATIVIGGLMSSSIQNVEDSVPVFGDIPVLGRLFKSTARKPVSSAIIFLVHVELLDPTGRPYRDR
jgi:general secretion pathway protein D